MSDTSTDTGPSVESFAEIAAPDPAPAVEAPAPTPEPETSIVTRDHIEQLKEEREEPVPALDYTMGGATETAVHSDVAAAREKEIADGERRLQEAADRMRTEAAFAALEGRARADFERER